MWRTSNGGENWNYDTTYEANCNLDFLSDLAYLGNTRNFISVTNAIGYIYKYTAEPESVINLPHENSEDIKIFPNPVPSGSPINIKYQTENPRQPGIPNIRLLRQ